MSVLIKGIDMPKDGGILCITIYPDGIVCLNRDLECKRIATAVPVQPHGRLIDATALIDAIIAKYIRHERNRELVFAVVEIKQDLADIINELPTIVDAEYDDIEADSEEAFQIASDAAMSGGSWEWTVDPAEEEK